MLKAEHTLRSRHHPCPYETNGKNPTDLKDLGAEPLHKLLIKLDWYLRIPLKPHDPLLLLQSSITTKILLSELPIHAAVLSLIKDAVNQQIAPLQQTTRRMGDQFRSIHIHRIGSNLELHF
ncbi:uncharacterized protein GJ701_001837 [Geothlypis trichas]